MVHARGKLVIGSSGAVDTTTSSDDPSITFALSTTGVYTMTFPPCVDCDMQFGVYSPTPTIGGVVLAAIDKAAGTATINTVVGVTKTQPASGDYIVVDLQMQSES